MKRMPKRRAWAQRQGNHYFHLAFQRVCTAACWLAALCMPLAALPAAAQAIRALPAPIASTSMAASAPTQPAIAGIAVTDDRGVMVRLPRTPQRIVSLLPALTESVCALGQCQRLVGVDRYSNYPASVQRLPQVGGGMDPNLEAIVALKPDVVLLAKSARLTPRLESLGIAVVALEPQSYADVRRVLHTLEVLLQVPSAQGAAPLWRTVEASVAAAAQSLPPAARHRRVYFQVGAGPYAAGEASFMGETLARLGARNVVPAAMGPFPRLNPEWVVRANPELIMAEASSAAAMAAYPGWSQIQALREERVCAFQAADMDVLVRPGPRMAEAARIMAKCLTEKGG